MTKWINNHINNNKKKKIINTIKLKNQKGAESGYHSDGH